MTLLSDFDFYIKHIKGVENKIVASLRKSVNQVSRISITYVKTYFIEQIKTKNLEYDIYRQYMKNQ